MDNYGNLASLMNVYIYGNNVTKYCQILNGNNFRFVAEVLTHISIIMYALLKITYVRPIAKYRKICNKGTIYKLINNAKKKYYYTRLNMSNTDMVS